MRKTPGFTAESPLSSQGTRKNDQLKTTQNVSFAIFLGEGDRWHEQVVIRFNLSEASPFHFSFERPEFPKGSRSTRDLSAKRKSVPI